MSQWGKLESVEACSWGTIKVNTWLEVEATLIDFLRPNFSGVWFDSKGTLDNCSLSSQTKNRIQQLLI